MLRCKTSHGCTELKFGYLGHLLHPQWYIYLPITGIFGRSNLLFCPLPAIFLFFWVCFRTLHIYTCTKCFAGFIYHVIYFFSPKPFFWGGRSRLEMSSVTYLRSMPNILYIHYLHIYSRLQKKKERKKEPSQPGF